MTRCLESLVSSFQEVYSESLLVATHSKLKSTGMQYIHAMTFIIMLLYVKADSEIGTSSIMQTSISTIIN